MQEVDWTSLKCQRCLRSEGKSITPRPVRSLLKGLFSWYNSSTYYSSKMILAYNHPPILKRIRNESNWIVSFIHIFNFIWLKVIEYKKTIFQKMHYERRWRSSILYDNSKVFFGPSISSNSSFTTTNTEQ